MPQIVDPVAAGMDGDRLERITGHFERAYIEPGKLAGCQVVVSRHGHTAYHRNFGRLSVADDRPVTDDTIWRIYSMTKPVTSVALMQLSEHARYKVTDPVHRYLPEWRGQRVAVVGEDGGMELVDPDRPVEVRDLLTHTGGIGYGWDPDHPVDALYREAGIRGAGVDLATMGKLLGDLPLKFHPGTTWHYSLSTDLCARLVEVIADEPFDTYLQEHVFDPLGMVDTTFSIRPADRDRFAANHARRADKSLRVSDDPYDSTYAEPPVFLSGGGGLLSTSGDYARFCEMLRRGGELDGARVLGAETLRFMTRNHLPNGAAMSDIAQGTLGDVGFEGVGFGLGFATTIDPVAAGVVGSAGDFFWGGAASTIFWVDPVQDLWVIFMVQLMPSGTFDFRSQLKQLVYAAIVV
ncbi:MAG TPA: serine hydrolase domain-containing protein [Acidimicrobiia bacterium]|jgi:CubicO group peptidase (beta-lactamase class C family)